MTLSLILMVLTLALMVTGRTPIYLTAIIGSALAAITAGFPLSGKEEITVLKLINGALNPVIADMAGVLMLIGIMEKVGFLNVIVKKVMQIGSRVGGGPGVVAGGSFVAGCIGALTGFTQPAVTAVITGPAATKLGVEPSKAAGLAAHAGHFGNFAGFTHPTQVAVIATAAIGFGLINVVGAITGLAIIMFSAVRLHREMVKNNTAPSKEAVAELVASLENKGDVSFGLAILPFIVFVAGFVLGYPVFLMGVISAVLTGIIAKVGMNASESAMIEGVGRIAVPLIATIGFLFMSAVMNKIGFVGIISDIFGSSVAIYPVATMFVVSALAGFFTQSNAAAAAVIIPFLQVVLAAGADPMPAAIAAAGGSAVLQYFLTGGPVAALSTVIPVIPGSNLRSANLFQRPAMIFGLAVLAVLVTIVDLTSGAGGFLSAGL